MDVPTNDHSDSDSGESWTLLDNDAVREESIKESKNINKSFIAENLEKDEDTDGISVISDSEAETPSSFVVHSLLEEQTIREEIPVYSPQNIDIETSITSNENKDTDPLVKDNVTADNIKHKIYVHRRNNRLSTVLNIIMLVSVMTAAGVAIGHMWGVKNDCPSQTTPSFNKILSDLYKLQAENANYRNKLKELSLIIEDHLHSECERESETMLNKEETVKCRQQKIHEIQKYLRTNVDGKRNKRTAIPYPKKQDESKVRKYLNAQNISKLKAIDELRFDVTSTSKDDPAAVKLQHEIFSEKLAPELREDKNVPERKISYADSLKSNNCVTSETNEEVYTNTEKKFKQRRKLRDSIQPHHRLPDSSISEEDLVKDNRYSTPKQKVERKNNDRQKFQKNTKRRNKHEVWELKEGLLKYYDDLSVKLLNNNNFIKSKTNHSDKKRTKLHKKMESDHDKINPYNEYILKGDMDNDVKLDDNLNWFDNRAKLRKEARRNQQLQLLNVSNPAEWHFKRMHRREQCRAKENYIYKKKGYKTKP